jgi:hypothetical protein
MTQPSRRTSLIFLASIIVLPILCVMTLALACQSPIPQILFVMPGYIRSILAGQSSVQSQFSPNSAYEAYVIESPSIDPPNQSLYIDRSDGIHFVVIAQLDEDADSIREIRWSPDSRIVVFSTWMNLFIVRLPDYQTLKIPLATEYVRYHKGKQSTFGGGIPSRRVTTIEFPQLGVVTYRLENDARIYQIDMNPF